MAISVVQFAHGSRSSAGTLTVTLGSAPTVGNVLVCLVCENTATHQPAHQTDSFSKIGAGSGSVRIDAYAATILSGNTGTSVTVAPTHTGGCAMVVYELSGATALGNGIQTANGTSSPVAASALTTTAASTILLGLSAAAPLVSGTSWTSQTSPWTNEINQTATGSVWGYNSAYQILTSTGTVTWSQTCVPHTETVAVALVAVKGSEPAPSNSVAPVASGTATVGQALSVTTGTWTNYGTAAYTYQWQRDNFGGGTFSDIAGAVSNTYTLTDTDDGCKVRCVVTNTDEYGATAANSNQLGAVVEPSPVNTVAPAATGSAYVGYVLTAGTGTWTGMGGHTATYGYQWQKDNSGGGTYSDISLATSSTYTVTSGELGDNVRCVVTATNDAASVSANSNAIGLIASPPATPSSTVAPVASGVVDVGLTVICGTGSWSSSVDSYGYQWQRDNSGGGTYSDIASATSSSYTLVDDDQGCQIRCTVSATNITGTGTAHSNALEWVDFYLSASIQFGDTFQEFGTGAAGGSSLVQQLQISRGRQNPLDQMQAGQCTFLFVNASGDLDPSNIDSPYYQQILPLVQCRVRRRFNGQSFQLFTGRVEDWQPQYLPPSAQLMQVPASDAFERLNNTPLVSGYGTLTTALSGSNNDLTFTSVQGGAIGDQTTVSYVVAGTSTPLSTSTNDPVTGHASILSHSTLRARGITRVGLGSGVGQSPSAPPSSVTVQGTDITVTVATNGSGTATSTASQVMAAMQADPAVSALVTVALAPGNTGAGTVAAMSGTLSGGMWPQELTGARIGRVLDTVGWDADLRALDDGTVQVVTKGFAVSDHATALQHPQNVADAELGYIFVDGSGVLTFHDANHRNTATRSTISQCTFADDGSGFKYEQSPQPNFSKDKIINQATVTAGGTVSVPQVVNDTYSQTGTGSPPAGATGTPSGGFGIRAIQPRSTELAADADAAAQAQLIVNLFAYPKVRFDQITTFEPADDDPLHDAWVASVLSLEIGDLVTVVITPPGTASTSSYQAFVEQITDTVQVGQRWKRTFQLSSRTQSSGGGGGGAGGAMLNTLGGTLILDDATNGVIG